MHSGHRHNRALRNGAGTGVWSVRPNYRVNLKAQQGEAEANYLRLRRLVPRIGLDQPVEVELPASGWIDERSLVEIRVIDQARYTETLALRQLDAIADWLRPLDISVRLYHDLRMAEVIRCQGQRPPWPTPPYRNLHMHHRDEKWQLNAFLGEWLKHCLRYGQVVEPAALGR